MATSYKRKWYKRWLSSCKKAIIWLWNHVQWAIIIGVFGGVPGIITIWNGTFSHPLFEFHPLIATEGRHDSTEYWVLTGAIFNNGNKPLFPVMFTLETTYKDRDQIFDVYSMAIPPDSILNADPKTRTYFKKDKDLLTVGRIEPNDAIYGNIYFQIFVSNIKSYPPKTEIETMKIICTDIKGDKKEYPIPFKESEVINGKFEEAKTGTIVH